MPVPVTVVFQMETFFLDDSYVIMLQMKSFWNNLQ